MKWLRLMGGMLCLAVSFGALAQEIAFELPRMTTPYIRDDAVLRLAANDEVQPTGGAASSSGTAQETTPEPGPAAFSGSNIHKYLGLGTMVGVALTVAAKPPENECETPGCVPQPRQTNGPHAKLARLTVGMAAATVATGLVAHWDDFYLEDGLTDPDNLHALLGTVGMAAMGYAVSIAADPYNGRGHAGKAIAGAALMAMAIKITW